MNIIIYHLKVVHSKYFLSPQEASFDYLEKASEVTLQEALDELELAVSKVVSTISILKNLAKTVQPFLC